jgi:hypothetical protein
MRVNSISIVARRHRKRHSLSSWTPQTLVVEDAAPTHIVMTGAVADMNAVASDFTIAGFAVDSLSRDITNKVITLTLTPTVYKNDVLNVIFKGRSYPVTNNVTYTISELRDRYTSLGFGTLCAFCMVEFTTYLMESINTHVPANTFNPTDLSINEWLDAYQTAGMTYIAIYTMNHDGFCMWNTATKVGANDPYSVEYSTWGIANGTPDIVALLAAGARSRGMKVILYWSMWDAEWERLTGTDETTNAAGLITYKKAQLSELLTNYGDIYAIWVDGWGWHIPYTEGAGVPYADMYNYIKSLQHNCLVINNDHLHSLTSTDIFIYEEPYEFLPINNTVDAESYKTLRVDNNGGFFLGVGQNTINYLTNNEVRIRRCLSNLRHATFLLCTSPDNTGHLATAQLSVLNSISTPITNPYSIDIFKETNGVRLNTHTPDLGSMWTEHIGEWYHLNDKVYSNTAGGATSIATKDDGHADFDAKVDFYMPAQLNYIGMQVIRYIDTTHHWRIVVERDAGGTPVIGLLEYGTLKGSLINLVHGDNVPHVLRVTALNETITVYWDGVQKIQYTGASSGKTATKHGIGTYQDATYTGVLFKNYLTEAL